MNQTSMKKLALTLLATFACGAVMAQENELDRSKNSGKIVAIGKADIVTQQPIIIFSNLDSAFHYNTVEFGQYVLGPANSVGMQEQWLALPFVSQVSSNAKVLGAAIQWISGTRRVRLGIYSDAQGMPGTLLPGGQGGTTVIPTYPSCCQFAIVTLPGVGPLVRAGTQYWLVATTDDTVSPDFTGVWRYSSLAATAQKVGAAGWDSSILAPGGFVRGATSETCGSPCSASTGVCVGRGSTYTCDTPSGFEDLLNLGENNDSVAFFPGGPFTVENVRELFASPYITVTLRDDGAIEIINSKQKEKTGNR